MDLSRTPQTKVVNSSGTRAVLQLVCQSDCVIIGVTRKKGAVALCGIFNHTKEQYVHLLEMNGDVEGELSLHHDFNTSTTSEKVRTEQDIKE